MFSITPKKIAVCAILVCAGGQFHAANAHVTLEYQVAPAASSYKAAFRVGHGCGTSPTRELVVHVPEGVQGAKPMPKAGWTTTVEREPLAQPGAEPGRPAAEAVRRVRWRANSAADALPGDFYDEFVLQARMPDAPGTLYWPVSQICEQGRVDWVQIPAAGQALHALPFPAAVLEVLPASGGHAH